MLARRTLAGHPHIKHTVGGKIGRGLVGFRFGARGGGGPLGGFGTLRRLRLLGRFRLCFGATTIRTRRIRTSRTAELILVTR